MNPLDYSLCTQTVTLYRKEDQCIRRQVLENCFFRLEQRRNVDTLGYRSEPAFLLIVPGQTQQVFEGDRILEGAGPEVGPDAWSQFIPALVSGLAVVTYVTPYHWDGVLCHVEAGGK